MGIENLVNQTFKVGKIGKYKPRKDNEGRYIEFCDYGWHQGVIVQKKPHCTECKHYYKFYLNKNI
jgi:hypothetical protein